VLMNKIYQGLFFTTLNEAQKSFKFHVWVMAIFQKLADWLDWPCPVSTVGINLRLSDPLTPRTSKLGWRYFQANKIDRNKLQICTN
jgi:hypothetical protein